MNWDRLQKNATRSGHFAGRGQTDEDAYFEAFANVDAPLINFKSAIQSARRTLNVLTNIRIPRIIRARTDV